MQEALGVADRVRFAGSTSTTPCLVQRASPVTPSMDALGEPAPGCGFQFYDDSPYYEYEDGPTALEEFDVEFSFSGNATVNQIPFTCASLTTTPFAHRSHCQVVDHTATTASSGLS